MPESEWAKMDNAIQVICAAMTVVTPIVQALGDEIRVSVLGEHQVRQAEIDALDSLLERISAQLGTPRFNVVQERKDLVAAEVAISLRLDLAKWASAASELAAVPDDTLNRAIALAQGARPSPIEITAADGAVLRCYASGHPASQPVVLATACGMPVGLTENWLHHLSSQFRVITWEARGMFALDQDFDELGHDLSIQASDLITVIETFGLEGVHVVGLCGGAPIALAAADSELIRSLSLWHGDYELGGQTPKSAHQQDMQAMLAMAGTDRAHAAAVHKLFQRQQTVDPLPAELAHYLLYPYATAEVLYRYALLNDAIMTTDCRPYVADLDKNCLVVTSANDTTAHPEGSVYVSEQLPRGRLRVLDTGDHLTAFQCQADLAQIATAFILENK